jgi:hypothetical protein
LQTYTFSTTFAKHTYIKIHENQASGLVADTKSAKDGWMAVWMDGWMDGWTDRHGL